MRQQRKIALLLAGCLLVTAFAGCGKKNNSDDANKPAVNNSTLDEAIEENAEETTEKKQSENAQIVITIPTVEITQEELKAQDYVVPMEITLEKNAGITYSEWGLSYDERCEVTASSTKLDYNTVYAFSSDKPFLWTAWSGGAQVFDYETPVLNLFVKLPEDVVVGDFYPITYADVSQANLPHKWSDGTNDWVAMDAVGWNDGGVQVVISPD